MIYGPMLMPVFWALFKDKYLISVPHFQTQVRKQLHIRITSRDAVEFFQTVEKTGYGKLVKHSVKRGPVKNTFSFNTYAFQCDMTLAATEIKK